MAVDYQAIKDAAEAELLKVLSLPATLSQPDRSHTYRTPDELHRVIDICDERLAQVEREARRGLSYVDI